MWTAQHESEVIWGRAQTVAPAETPISDAEAKAYSRIHHTSDDATITRLVSLAVEYCFEHTERQLVNATYLLTRRCFPRNSRVPMRIPIYPLVSITSIQYVDTDGVLQTWSSSLYQANTRVEPGVVEPVYGEVYPVARDEEQAVRVTAVCGHGAAAANVPERHKQAIHELVSYWYANRGSISPPTVDGSFAPTIDALIEQSDACPLVG